MRILQQIIANVYITQVFLFSSFQNGAVTCAAFKHRFQPMMSLKDDKKNYLSTNHLVYYVVLQATVDEMHE